MHATMTRVWVAVAAAAALSASGVTDAAATGAPGQAPQQPRAPSAAFAAPTVPGAQLWLQRYTGPGSGHDLALSVAVSPGGGAVFVTGRSFAPASGWDYLTVAYNAATGAQLWVKRYNSPGNNADEARSVAVSPSGDKVFVTGGSAYDTSAADYATVAYNAATGAQLWVKRYNGPASNQDAAFSVAVSPSGGTVFVTGDSVGANSDLDYATVAYNAATGAQLWVMRYNGPGNRDDGAAAVAVNPSGSKVFVTGSSTGKTSGPDYATIAYGG